MENNQQLSRLYKTNDSDIQVVANKMKEYFGNENDEALNVISQKLTIHPELIGSFCSDATKQEWENLNIQKLKKLFASDEKILEVYTNLQIELVKKAGDRLIASRLQQYEGERNAQAMQIKAALTEFAQTKINQMSETFKESKTAFGRRRAEQRSDAMQYKDTDEFYYKILMENLDKEAVFFFNTIEESLKGFIKAINEKAMKPQIG